MLIVILWDVPRRTAGLCLSPFELILCYCCKFNNMIYGINNVNICMSDILACVECFGVLLHCTLVGSNPSREIPLLALLTLPRETFFRYRRRTWEWDAFRALEAKKWPNGQETHFCINCN